MSAFEVRSVRDVRGIERHDCDVVIVGSGAGGASAAYELARAGLSVIVLEAGPWFRPEDLTQRELDTIQRVWVDQGAQGPSDGSMSVLQGRCVGGSTLVNAEVCFRIPDAVLHEWSRDHGVRGLSPASLAPVFDDVERMVNASPTPPDMRGGSDRMAAGFEKLGRTVLPTVRNVRGCRGCNYCLFGCGWGCKQSMDQSYLPAAAREGAVIFADAPVDRILMRSGLAVGVSATLEAGSIEVFARAVVLAAGAIETPLLLAAHALGGPEAGRHLAVHPVVFVWGEFDEDVRHERSPTLSRYVDYASEGWLVELGVASAAFSAIYMPAGREGKEIARSIGRWSLAAGIVRDVDAPGRVSRTRGGDKRVEYRLGDASSHVVRRALRTLSEAAFAAGASRVLLGTTPATLLRPNELDRIDALSLAPADFTYSSYHPQCTARIGEVTREDGSVSGTQGLFVMDASLFPSPVGVNPQVAIMAVSTVLARGLAARLRG